jgi:hypothetical protein
VKYGTQFDHIVDHAMPVGRRGDLSRVFSKNVRNVATDACKNAPLPSLSWDRIYYEITKEKTVPEWTNLNLWQPDFWSIFHHKIHDWVRCYQKRDSPYNHIINLVRLWSTFITYSKWTFPSFDSIYIKICLQCRQHSLVWRDYISSKVERILSLAWNGWMATKL